MAGISTIRGDFSPSFDEHSHTHQQPPTTDRDADDTNNSCLGATPQHPVPSMQGPFEESFEEAQLSEDWMLPIESQDACQRREIMLQTDDKSSNGTLNAQWRKQNHRKYHPLLKVFAQLAFGMDLLYSDNAQDDHAVMRVMRRHMLDLHLYLKSLAEDLVEGLTDVCERIGYLKVTLEYDSVLEAMFDNSRISEPMSATITSVKKSIRYTLTQTEDAEMDVKQGRETCQDLIGFLDDIAPDCSVGRPLQQAVHTYLGQEASHWMQKFDEIELGATRLKTATQSLQSVCSDLETRISVFQENKSKVLSTSSPVPKLIQTPTGLNSSSGPISISSISRPSPLPNSTNRPRNKHHLQARDPQYDSERVSDLVSFFDKTPPPFDPSSLLRNNDNAETSPTGGQSTFSSKFLAGSRIFASLSGTKSSAVSVHMDEGPPQTPEPSIQAPKIATPCTPKTPATKDDFVSRPILAINSFGTYRMVEVGCGGYKAAGLPPTVIIPKEKPKILQPGPHVHDVCSPESVLQASHGWIPARSSEPTSPIQDDRDGSVSPSNISFMLPTNPADSRRLPSPGLGETRKDNFSSSDTFSHSTNLLTPQYSHFNQNKVAGPEGSGDVAGKSDWHSPKSRMVREVNSPGAHVSDSSSAVISLRPERKSRSSARRVSASDASKRGRSTSGRKARSGSFSNAKLALFPSPTPQEQVLEQARRSLTGTPLRSSLGPLDQANETQVRSSGYSITPGFDQYGPRPFSWGNSERRQSKRSILEEVVVTKNLVDDDNSLENDVNGKDNEASLLSVGSRSSRRTDLKKESRRDGIELSDSSLNGRPGVTRLNFRISGLGRSISSSGEHRRRSASSVISQLSHNSMPLQADSSNNHGSIIGIPLSTTPSVKGRTRKLSMSSARASLRGSSIVASPPSRCDSAYTETRTQSSTTEPPSSRHQPLSPSSARQFRNSGQLDAQLKSLTGSTLGKSTELSDLRCTGQVPPTNTDLPPSFTALPQGGGHSGLAEVEGHKAPRLASSIQSLRQMFRTKLYTKTLESELPSG